MQPQPRSRAQADLELAISEAEADQHKWVETIAQLKAAGRPARGEEVRLYLATRKLSRLRACLALLANGEDAEWQS